MYIILLQNKNPRQLKDIVISYFRFLHCKTWADLSLELEKTLYMCLGHVFSKFEKPHNFLLPGTFFCRHRKHVWPLVLETEIVNANYFRSLVIFFFLGGGAEVLMAEKILTPLTF
jgi:hypothetical protein